MNLRKLSNLFLSYWENSRMEFKFEEMLSLARLTSANTPFWTPPTPLTMSTLDISRKIRVVLDSDSPVRNLPEVLINVKAFVHQQQEAPEWAILDQIRDDLESMYKELVDHTSSANVEAFVSILCAFLPVFRPIYVITCWWDLVLRAALRDPRLSGKTLQQVKELALHGLVPDSPKAAEFRKRIIELYLLDAYDESSGLDAIERATMSVDERRVQQFWKHNLRDVLGDFCMKRPEEFFTAINLFFMTPKCRLRLSVLLGVVVRSPDFPVQEFAGHAILHSLLMSLVVDGSSTLFEIEIAALATLLPQFAVHASDTLIRILPFCYAIFARVVCWKPRSKPSDLKEREDAHSETSSQTHQSDLEMDVAQTSHIRSDLDWQKLEATFVSAASGPPSPLPLFRTLYGLYPCNTLAFLKDPVAYLTSAKLESPFLSDWPDVVDEGQIRTRSRALLRHNILHSALLTHTAESELAERDRWAQWDVPRIVMMCTMLDVRNAALSLRRMSDELHVPDVGDTPTEDFPSTHNSPGRERPETQNTETPATELRGTDFSVPGRPRVSVQDILATYHALKSGVEIDIVDPTPEWPQMLFPSTTPSPSAAESTGSTPKPSSPPASDEAIPPHVEEVISSLQRENLLLRNELNYELWLKRENVKRIGRLYEDRILVKGAEVERQGLHNKLREYKGQVQRLQEALAKEQAGATATKSQHADYSSRLQARLKAERDEKRSWADEKSKLKSVSEDAKAMLEAQAGRLAEASNRVFELETQIKENQPKVQRLRDYEDKIEQLTKTQQLWDDDVRRYKTQESYLEELRSRYRKKLLLVESYEKANQDLEETINTLQRRVSALESQTSQRPPAESSPTAFQMIEALREQVAKLTAESSVLKDKNDDLGDQNEDLKVTVEGLRGRLRLTEESTVHED